jgi:hypothetical protein
MHITLGEVSSNLKPAAVEVLRVLVDGCFPDKVRRVGANLILRVDYLSVGTIAKRAHWCSIDERDEARHLASLPITIEAFNDAMACVAGDRDAKIPPVTKPAAIAAAVAGALNLDLSAAAAVAAAIVERRSLLAAKRRVDRALGQLVKIGIITRTRRAGGRSITLIELRAPFDIEEPGSTPPPGDSTDALAPGDSTDKPAARNDENVAPGGPARNDRNVAPVATQTSSPERHERRHRCDENVAPSPLSSPLSTPKKGIQQTNSTTTPSVAGGGDAGCAFDDDEEDRRVPDTDRERIDERRKMLRDAGVRGRMLDELSCRRLSLHTVASIIGDAEDQTSLDNPPGFIVMELQGTPDDITDDAPARRYWKAPATIAEAVEQVDEGRDALEVYDIMTAGLSTPNRITWLHEVADWLNLDPNRVLSSDKLATMPEVRREVSEALIGTWKCANGRGE